MCYRPLKITNSRTFFRTGLDKKTVFVPCGHCEQCRQMQINDWYVRLSSEYDYYTSEYVRGMVLFVTCTFNEYSVPRFDSSKVSCLEEFSEFDFSYYDGQLVFGKQDVVQFIKHLRELLVKEGIKEGVKYFLVTELGTDDDKTHRPHYHILFFLPQRVNTSHFLGLINYAWADRIKIEDYPELKVPDIELQKQFAYGYYYQNQNVIVRPENGCAGTTYALRRGFCNYSKDRATGKTIPELKNNLGVKYILKYLYKDDLYMSNSFARDIAEQLKNFPTITELEEKIDGYKVNKKTGEVINKSIYSDEDCEKILSQIDAIRYLKNCLPFHLQSKGLGAKMVEEYQKKQNYDDIIMHKKIAVTCDSEKFFVPRYVIRKLCYQIEKIPELELYKKDNRVAVLTATGARILKDMYKFNLELKKESYEYLLSNKIISKLKSCSYDSWKDIDISSMRSFLSKHSDLLAVYESIYKDVFVSVSNNIFRYNSEELQRLAECMFNLKVDTNNNYYTFDIGEYPVAIDLFAPLGVSPLESDNMQSIIYNYLPQFSGFDDFLDNLRRISNLVNTRHYETKHKEYLEKLKTRKVQSHVYYNN